MRAASSVSGSGAPSSDDGSERRLVAIAFVDIVGYSILMSEDEAGTHRRWMAHLANVIRRGAERHRGGSSSPPVTVFSQSFRVRWTRSTGRAKSSTPSTDRRLQKQIRLLCVLRFTSAR